jgi:hypothetical protein
MLFPCDHHDADSVANFHPHVQLISHRVGLVDSAQIPSTSSQWSQCRVEKNPVTYLLTVNLFATSPLAKPLVLRQMIPVLATRNVGGTTILLHTHNPSSS